MELNRKRAGIFAEPIIFGILIAAIFIKLMLGICVKSIILRNVILMFELVMQIFKYILGIVIVLFTVCIMDVSAKSDADTSWKYYLSAKILRPWSLEYIVGMSVSHLPSIVVEEEISQSPMLMCGLKLGMPYNLNFALSLQSNYIANYGLSELYWNMIDNKFSLSFGVKFAMWFGHLEMDAIHLKSYGGILYPSIKMSYDFDKYVISSELESQHSQMTTSSEGEILGTLREPSAGFALRLSIEQELWESQIVALSVKINYAKFYYQSWLSFNTIDEFLLYPEILFAFEL